MKMRCILFAVLAALNLLLLSPYSPARFIRWNVSESLPYKLLIAAPLTGTPERGQIVSIVPDGSVMSLAKRVLGLPGDSIASGAEGIVVASSGEEILLKPAPDSCHLHLMASQQIPEGYYFLAGEHPSSFDSRYEEFGLVAEAEIGELLWPVF